MIKHYECDPATWREKRWVFDWDDETGEITGPDAETIKQAAEAGGISIHPFPSAWSFCNTPLKSKTDMAAIIGLGHRLPDSLIPFYPNIESNYHIEEDGGDNDGVDAIFPKVEVLY